MDANNCDQDDIYIYIYIYIYEKKNDREITWLIYRNHEVSNK